ncbi:MAG: N-acetylmuramoyl-L-alanine amidase [Thermodesulfovibrio sp.]|nr:N-acetylmuramoyl-L-alanine amidase [Thermodesulfovibrio sp.]
MIKIFLVLVLLIFSAYAQESKRIIVKFGKHQNFYRFVFVCDSQDIVYSINVNLIKKGTVKLSLPDVFEFQFEDRILKEDDKIGNIRVKKEHNSFLIETSNVEEIKVTRLDSPARLVIDAYFDQTLKIEQPIKSQIVIDPGHGGRDLGFRDKELFEKDILLDISKKLTLKLTQRGLKVSLTRVSDEDLSLRKRIEIANNLSPSIFLSLHISTAEIFVIYKSPIKKSISKDSIDILAKEDRFIGILNEKIKSRFSEPVVIEKIPLSILKELQSPSLVVELPKRVFIEETFRDKLIDCIYESLVDYIKKDKK